MAVGTVSDGREAAPYLTRCAHQSLGVWAGVSQCRKSAARPRSRPGGPVRRLGGEAVGSAARGEAQVSRARGRRGEPGGPGSLWVWLTRSLM